MLGNPSCLIAINDINTVLFMLFLQLGNNCDSYFAMLYNLGLSVSLAKQNYKIPAYDNNCLFLSSGFASDVCCFFDIHTFYCTEHLPLFSQRPHRGFNPVLDIQASC